MPRHRPDPDAPPLPAARWSPPPMIAGGVVGVGVGVLWGVLAGGGWEEWAAAGLLAAAAGLAAALVVEAMVDRMRAGKAEAELAGERPAGWAEDARGESRHHAERLDRAADGGDRPVSTQRYVGEFFRRASAWVDATKGRLVGRFPLWAVAAVLGVAGGCVRLTPERAKELNFVALGWPAVLSAVAGTLGGMEALGRAGRWERVWGRWREWATDREAPALPPPSPLVPVIPPPPPKPQKPKVPPPPVVPLEVPPPPPPPPPPLPPPPPPPVVKPPSFLDNLLKHNPNPPDRGDDEK